jgi:SAM-dependent methyltransferase
VAGRNQPFYIEEYVRTDGLAVELGIGNGRIAIEAARRGKPVSGVDSSAEMLARCRERADAAGVAPLLTLHQADFRDFALPEPAHLIAIPFHTIGHLVTIEDKRAALRRIHSHLVPGGRLIFDHFVFNPESARRNASPGLHAEYTDAATGRDVLLWAGATYDFAAQTMRLIAWTDAGAGARAAVGDRLRDRDSLRRFRPKSLRPRITRADLGGPAACVMTHWVAG